MKGYPLVESRALYAPAPRVRGVVPGAGAKLSDGRPVIKYLILQQPEEPAYMLPLALDPETGRLTSVEAETVEL